MQNQSFRRALLAFFALILGLGSARAQSTLYWNNARQTWATNSATWVTNPAGGGTSISWVNGDSADFSAGTNLTNSYTITNSGVIVDNITVEEGRIHVVNGVLTLHDQSATYNVATHTAGADYDLLIDSTINNSPTNASSITKTGSGILMLTGTNNYSGGTTVSGGMLSWKNSDRPFGTGIVTLGGGSFLHNATNGNTTLGNTLHVTANTKVGSRGGNVFLNGSLTGSGTFDVSNSTNDFNGLSIASATILLTNPDLSGFTGTIAHNTLSSGGNRLDFGPSPGVGNITVNAANAKINLSGSTTGPNTAGLADGNYGTFKIGELAGSGGRIRAGNTAAGNTTFEVGYLNTSSTFGGVIANYDNGSGGRALLTKVGTGTLTLTGANTYTGGTTVSGGTLVINGSVASAVNVNSGASLGGSGTINGATTISGTHSPGNSPGIQTFSAGLTYETGSTFVWELIANTVSGSARGTSFDGVNVTGGTLSIGTGVNTSLVFNASGSTVAWTNSLWASNQQWLVFSNAGTTTGSFSTISLSADSNGDSLASIRSGASFSWTAVNNDIYLNYTAVPEPGTYALLLLGAALVTIHLRRQKNAPR